MNYSENPYRKIIFEEVVFRCGLVAKLVAWYTHNNFDLLLEGKRLVEGRD